MLIERYDPAWAHAVSYERHEVGDVMVTWHDVRHYGDVLRAAVTYDVEGRSWTQRFTAEILDDDRFRTEAEEAGLILDLWLDAQRWARLLA